MILNSLKWCMILIPYNEMSVLTAFIPDRLHHVGSPYSELIRAIQAKVGLVNAIS